MNDEVTMFNSNLLSAVSEQAARMKNPLVLAYIGDTVYDLYVRSYYVKDSGEPVNLLNRRVCALVNAHAQAAAADRLLPALSEEEADVFRRGRNAKSGTLPKNMSVADYHKATGIEAVIGYLYLVGAYARLEEIFEIILLESEKT
jgi:ribonuclease-3 family protein